MSIKITPDHLNRAAVVYVRQSTMSQVMGNLESSGGSMQAGSQSQGTNLMSVIFLALLPSAS
jgi:hypothetical protein